MANILFLGVSIALILGFFALTIVEAQSGNRVLAGTRKKFDAFVERTFFVVENVNWGEFFRHVVQGAIIRFAHDIAHGSLRIVRFIERQLTRTVRYMRDRRPNVLAPKPSRISPLVQTVTYFRKSISRSKSKDSITSD